MTDCFLFNKIINRYPFDENENDSGLSYSENLLDEQCGIRIADALPKSNVINIKFTEKDEVYSGIYYMNLFADINSNIVNCKFGKSNNICIERDIDGKVQQRLYSKDLIELVVFPDNNIYCNVNTQKGTKLVPLHFSAITLEILKNPYFKNFFVYILRIFGAEYKIYDKISTYFEKDLLFILPVSFQKVKQYTSFKELFLSEYKTAKLINNNWNTKNVNLSYLILKTWNYVVPEQRNKLLQINKINIADYSGKKLKNKIKRFLYAYLDNQFKIYDEKYHNFSYEDEIYDYINMCMITKEKVNINFRSYTKLENAHNEISNKAYMKKTPLVKVKKNTKFASLRKILPKDFEWIKTRKRLIQETIMQHHCVWSYAEYINKDICQIYSYVDDIGERFTLEFKVVKGKYVCVQIQGKYNKANTEKVLNIVKDILSKDTNKII
jgi:hypothetical protein